jgi:hypothetical protein
MQAHTRPQPRHYSIWLFGRVCALALGLAVLIWGGAGLVVYRAFTEIDYPGSTSASKQFITKTSPGFVVRSDSVYRSKDAFNRLYDWYSTGFSLGPERHAQGKCILMARSTRILWRIDQNMSVMLCDTPSDRMAFVMRSFSIRYPDWLRPVMELLASFERVIYAHISAASAA